MSDLEKLAWKLYCDRTKGAMSARDFWWELSDTQKAYYLSSAKRADFTTDDWT